MSVSAKGGSSECDYNSSIINCFGHDGRQMAGAVSVNKLLAHPESTVGRNMYDKTLEMWGKLLR
eukprot:scaffold203062_cov70-Attheya_sp.AAC.3